MNIWRKKKEGNANHPQQNGAILESYYNAKIFMSILKGISFFTLKNNMDLIIQQFKIYHYLFAYYYYFLIQLGKIRFFFLFSSNQI